MDIIKKLQHKKEPYTPTEVYTRLWFNILNKRLFNKQLTQFSNIIITDLGDWWACVAYDDTFICPDIDIHLNNQFKNSWHFINVLGHEMVHKWQLEINHVNNDLVNHNKYFFSWRPKFKENGLDLNRYG